MTLTLTTTPEPNNVPPRVRLDVLSTAGTPNPLLGTELVTLFRVDPDGRTRKVIVPADSRLSAHAWTGYDYHAPFNKPVGYQVVAGNATVDSAGSNGYWNYAPLPNVLPSRVAAMGRAGAPSGNGWRVPVSGNATITASGGNIAVKPTAVGPDSMVEVSIFDVPVTSAGNWTLTVDFAAGPTQNARLSVFWYTSDGDDISGYTGSWVAVASGPVLTLVGARPAGAGKCSVRVELSSSGTLNSAFLSGITLEPGGASSGILSPVFIPTPPVPALLVSSQAWLIHPVDPGLSVKVNVSGLATRTTRGSRAALFPVIGASRPVTRSDGVRASLTGETTVFVDDLAAADALDELCARSEAVLINLASTVDRPIDYPWLWVQPETVTREWVNAGIEMRRVIFGWVEVDQPTAPGGALWTWDDVGLAYSTIDAVNAQYASLANLVTETPGV